MLGWGMSVRAQGMAKKGHGGCSCGMCKPWKNGWTKDTHRVAKLRLATEDEEE